MQYKHWRLNWFGKHCDQSWETLVSDPESLLCTPRRGSNFGSRPWSRQMANGGIKLSLRYGDITVLDILHSKWTGCLSRSISGFFWRSADIRAHTQVYPVITAQVTVLLTEIGPPRATFGSIRRISFPFPCVWKSGQQMDNWVSPIRTCDPLF